MKEKVKSDYQDVEIITESMSQNILKSFNNGEKCGNGDPVLLVAQELILNPVLYKGHKMDFRLYFFVNSAKSMQTSFFNGFGRVCPASFNNTSFESEVHISNIRSTFSILEKNNVTKIKSEPAKDFVIKTFDEIQSYLSKEYKIDFMEVTDKVRDMIMTILKHSSISKAKPDSQFQLFAADYVVTTDGKAKLLEINAFPEFIDNSSKKTKIYREVFKNIGRRIRNKLLHTKASLRGFIEKENFDEMSAIEYVSKLDL